MLDDYVAWLDAHRLRSDMNLGRFYWYRRKLQSVLSSLGQGQIGPYLEIGAGSGRFALMMTETGLTDHIVLVDLPEMLLNAALLVSEENPETFIRYSDAPDFSAAPGVWLLETTDIQKVNAGSIGMVVNINSMMEMDEEIRDFYIAEAYRVLRSGGLFYNVNRRQKQMSRRDGSTFDSNPLLYPYRPTDRIIEWEVDNSQMTCKSAWAFSPGSYAISRISQVP
jgi:SAM-dependent methyltransferase